MTGDELDQVRRIVVAFEDAATWCEQLATLARESIEAIRQKRLPSEGELSERLQRIDDVLRNIEGDREAVGWVRERIGLPSPPR